MRGFGELMRAKNISPEPLLRAVGIPIAALVDDELRISLPAYAHLLEHSVGLTGCDDIGLQMSDWQDISLLGPIAIAMQNAATVGDGLRVCQQFAHTHSPGIRLTVLNHSPQQGVASLRLSLVLPSGLNSVQLLEQCLADLFNFIAWMAPETVPWLAVHLPHAPVTDLARYIEVFSLPPQFEEPWAELQVPSDFLEWSLAGASEDIHRLSVQYLELRYSRGDQTVSEQVETVLTKALSSTGGSREAVAKLLAMHPRTLQRRLADEGTTYQNILDTVRQAESLKWLAEVNTPLAHIPAFLGLADQAVFTRSCQRWFGKTPAAIRKSGGV